MKLVNTTEFETSKCRVCEKIETKFRRRSAEKQRLARWQEEGSTLVASAARSQALIIKLDREISELQHERDERRQVLGGPSNTQPVQRPCTDSGYASVNPYPEFKHDSQRAQVPADIDTGTEYSDVSTVAGFKNETFIYELVDDLFAKIAPLALSDEIMRAIIDLLPDILKNFALRIGYNASTQMHRNVMFFIHKNRQ